MRSFMYKYNLMYDDWFSDFNNIDISRCTLGVRVSFSVARMQSSHARKNKCNFTTEKIV